MQKYVFFLRLFKNAVLFPIPVFGNMLFYEQKTTLPPNTIKVKKRQTGFAMTSRPNIPLSQQSRFTVNSATADPIRTLWPVSGQVAPPSWRDTIRRRLP